MKRAVISILVIIHFTLLLVKLLSPEDEVPQRKKFPAVAYKMDSMFKVYVNTRDRDIKKADAAGQNLNRSLDSLMQIKYAALENRCDSGQRAALHKEQEAWLRSVPIFMRTMGIADSAQAKNNAITLEIRAVNMERRILQLDTQQVSKYAQIPLR